MFKLAFVMFKYFLYCVVSGIRVAWFPLIVYYKLNYRYLSTNLFIIELMLMFILYRLKLKSFNDLK